MSGAPILLELPSAVREAALLPLPLLLAASDVAELLDALAHHAPLAERMVRDEQGRLRPHLALFVNEVARRGPTLRTTPLQPGDRVTILPAVSGG
ncbi:MAG: MoaD/ThiS family protein [Planctomycetes bacterium]|nr:MoaD/ThiS family protein [Planctomycetota bacterium]